MAQTRHSEIAVIILIWQSSIHPAWTLDVGILNMTLPLPKRILCIKRVPWFKFETSKCLDRAVVPAGSALWARHRLHYGSQEQTCGLLLRWSASAGWGRSSVPWETFSWGLRDRNTHMYLYVYACLHPPISNTGCGVEMIYSPHFNQCSFLHWLCKCSDFTVFTWV